MDSGRRSDLGILQFGRSFLRNMVRAIVGTLFEVGRGKMTVQDFKQVIEPQDRGKAGIPQPGQASFG